MDFWEFVWFIVISYVFIAYLILLFNIVTDIFRDREMSGFVKAVWLFALIFVPLLTALVYVISRGSGMVERSFEAQERQRAQQDDYIRSVAGSTGPATMIAQGKSLMDAGVIDQAEYEAIKLKALA